MLKVVELVIMSIDNNTRTTIMYIHLLYQMSVLDHCTHIIHYYKPVIAELAHLSEFSVLCRCIIYFLFLVDSGTTDATPIIPEIKGDYMEIKRTLVRVCTTETSPTLKEVKDLCLDLLECAFKNIPLMSGYTSKIWEATTMEDIMHIVCFRLSNWLSYNFLKRIIAEFQPSLQSITDKLACYEDKLTPLLRQKLGDIKELQQR